jgi:RNA polymerase sigma-70 factor (ECF subfamily)
LIKNSIITDKEILLKIGKNDLEAFDLLYDRYAPLLYTMIKKISGDKETSEKILTETFLIIWRWAEEFDFVIHNVYTWMVLLARNKAIDSLKRQRGDCSLPEYNDEYEILRILPQISHENESMEREYILKQCDEISAIVNSLTDEQKYLFSLVYYKGMDEKNIAAKLGIPAATVKPQIQYIMGILMQNLIK